MDNNSLDILEAISYYGAQAFIIHGPMPPPPSYMITCTLPYNDTEFGDIMHSPGHFLLTSRDDFTSHGSMFNTATSQFLGFTSHGLNSQAPFLSHQFTSVE